MALSKFEPIWKLMNKYKFKVGIDSMDTNMFCLICKNLMVDACESVCGCHYCHECIDGYLKNEDKFCPGGKNQCKEGFLVMERDVFRNLRINNDIYKLIVLCPNDSCKSNINLTQMEEHLRVCTKQSMECPYLNIGCDNNSMTKDAIFAHLNSDVLPHTQLLIEWIQNLKNEVDGMREESRLKDIHIGEIVAQIETHKREIECVKNDCRDKVMTLEEQLRALTNEMEIKVNGEREERMKLMKEEREEMKRMMNDSRGEIDNVMMTMKEVDGIRECREKRMTNLIKVYPIIDADFVWRIDGYTKKRETYIDSESFYANNYKLCLRLFIDSDGSVGFYYRIMKGDNDDKAQWPLIRAVTLAVIDQATLGAHSAVTYKYDTYKYNKNIFNRPTNEANDWIGYLSHWSIKGSPSLTVGDAIVVSCVVTDP